ncbi:putative ribonuclease H-like domain-containing protein [Tanacetum coccineum]
MITHGILGLLLFLYPILNHQALPRCLLYDHLGWKQMYWKNLMQIQIQCLNLSDLPNGKRAIGTKWVFRNKKDERGIVIRNKARLVVQGYREPLGIGLCFTQPPGLKILDHPDKVTRVVKALYELHNDQVAWYENLRQNLSVGPIVYVDDIIFGSINKELCTAFEKLMKDKFQMSSMGELTFFLGLQLTQKEDRIFISQDKYVAKILKKLNYTDVKSASTPVDLEKPLVKDGDADDVDVHLYRYMIGSLMYLTSSRPDIMSALCACARFQVTLKTSYLLVVRRIFRYLKGKPTLGLWYSRDSPFELVVYTDSDYAGATQDRKSTTRACNSFCYVSLWNLPWYLDVIIREFSFRTYQLEGSKVFRQCSRMSGIGELNGAKARAKPGLRRVRRIAFELFHCLLFE